MNPSDYISRILAQCAVQPALADVYAELLLQGAGQELYSEPLIKHTAIHGKSFGEASRRFGKAIPLGIVRPAPGSGEVSTSPSGSFTLQGDEEVHLSPSDDLLLQPTDQILLMAKSRGDTRPGRMRAAVKPPKVKAVKAAAGEETEGSKEKVKAAMEAAVAATPNQKPPRILLLNVDWTMPDFIEQIDEVCRSSTRTQQLQHPPSSPLTPLPSPLQSQVAPKGASLTLFCPERPNNLPSMSRASMKYIRGDPSSVTDMKKIAAHKYDAVIYLQPGDGSDESDSKLLLSLLALQQSSRDEGTAMPRVVGEVHSPQMLDLIRSRWPENQWDFIQSNDLCSGILVQFALQPELRNVYSELLASEGKEIILRPARNYLDKPMSELKNKYVTFEQLGLGARAKGEVAVGVHLAGEASPILNPPRDLRLKLNDGDELVVLGQAF